MTMAQSVTSDQIVQLAPGASRKSRRARVWSAVWRWLFGAPRRRTMPVAAVPEQQVMALVDAGGADSAKAAPRLSSGNATARIIAAFDSAHPVRQRKDLHGRDDKLQALFEAVLYSRQHAIIHGARGSGKTSLAQVFGDYADQQGAVVIYTACEASTPFAELVRPYLAFIPDSCVPFAEKHAFQREREALMNGDFGPRAIVDLFARLEPESQIILILDEFDRVENEEINSQIATFMKLLSDARLPVQMLLVGIARTVEELILCHPSLRRHMVPIAIGRISRDDTLSLITNGAQRAGVAFDEESRNEIAFISCGSPYHVQLFCSVAAIEAVRRGVTTIDAPITRVGMRRAFDTWAMLNPDDADLFVKLASADLETRANIQRAAREAAMRDSLPAEEQTEALLAPALNRDGRRTDRLYFRDGAAPQFLLAILALQQGGRARSA